MKRNNYTELIYTPNRHYLILWFGYLVEIVYFYPLFQYMVRIEGQFSEVQKIMALVKINLKGIPFLRLKNQ